VIGEITDAAPDTPINIADSRRLFEKGEGPPDQCTKEFERATGQCLLAAAHSADQTSIVVAGVATCPSRGLGVSESTQSLMISYRCVLLLAHGGKFRQCNNFGSYLRVNRPAERVIFMAALDPFRSWRFAGQCTATNLRLSCAGL
jgi:hypothetical protein